MEWNCLLGIEVLDEGRFSERSENLSHLMQSITSLPNQAKNVTDHQKWEGKALRGAILSFDRELAQPGTGGGTKSLQKTSTIVDIGHCVRGFLRGGQFR